MSRPHADRLQHRRTTRKLGAAPRGTRAGKTGRRPRPDHYENDEYQEDDER